MLVIYKMSQNNFGLVWFFNLKTEERKLEKCIFVKAHIEKNKVFIFIKYILWCMYVGETTPWEDSNWVVNITYRNTTLPKSLNIWVLAYLCYINYSLIIIHVALYPHMYTLYTIHGNHESTTQVHPWKPTSKLPPLAIPICWTFFQNHLCGLCRLALSLLQLQKGPLTPSHTSPWALVPLVREITSWGNFNWVVNIIYRNTT